MNRSGRGLVCAVAGCLLIVVAIALGCGGQGARVVVSLYAVGPVLVGYGVYVLLRAGELD
jgi:hypothetical protein